LMSLWRPIMCRTSQMFPPPLPPPTTTTRNSNPTATDLSMLTASNSIHPYLHSISVDPSKTTTTTTASHHNNNNTTSKNCSSHQHNNNNKISIDSHAHLASPTTSSKFSTVLFNLLRTLLYFQLLYREFRMFRLPSQL
jgi:hypothetical protein